MTTIVNWRLLWQGNNAVIMTWNATFSFNWYNLANGITTRVTRHNLDDLSKVDFETFNYAQQDWWGVLWRYFRTKTINIWMSIKAENETALNELIDELKFQCSAIQAPLRIKNNGVVRERTATCTDINFNKQPYNIDRLWHVELTFKAQFPHAHSLKPILKDITSQTWLYKTAISYLWRADSFFALSMAIETAWTYAIYIKVNGFTLSLASRAYTIWDIIKFDWVSKKATINDTEVEYNGSFRPLQYWDNPVEVYYWWTFTATLSYYENYL